MEDRRWKVLILVVALAGAGWIAVNRVPGPDVAGASAEGRLTGQPLPAAPAVGHPAPEIQLVDTAGERFELSALRGTPVVLNFWATWCPPCRAEMPELEAAHVSLADQVAVVGVNQGESQAEVAAFAQGIGVSFSLPLDERMDASRTYAVRSLPTTFFIDRSGIIRRIQVGPLTEATLAQSLRAIYP